MATDTASSGQAASLIFTSDRRPPIGGVGPLFYRVFETTSGTWLSTPGTPEFTDEITRAHIYAVKSLATDWINQHQVLSVPEYQISPYFSVRFAVKKKRKWYGFARFGGNVTLRERQNATLFRNSRTPLRCQEHPSPLKFVVVAFQNVALTESSAALVTLREGTLDDKATTGSSVAVSPAAEFAQLPLEF